jgi:hypothetical protein
MCYNLRGKKIFYAYEKVFNFNFFYFYSKISATIEKFEDIKAGINYESHEPLVVSLGSFCGPASMIKTVGLRVGSFPFDWMLSVNGDKIIEILNSDFQNCLDRAYLEPFVNGVLLHKKYHIEFSHEGDWSGSKFTDNYIDFC